MTSEKWSQQEKINEELNESIYLCAISGDTEVGYTNNIINSSKFASANHTHIDQYFGSSGGTISELTVTGNTTLNFADISSLRVGGLQVTGTSFFNGQIAASSANLGTTKISGNLTATGVTITTDNISGKYASFNTVDDNGDPSLRATSNAGIAFISNTTGPLGNYLTSTTGTTLMTQSISGNAIYAYSSSGDPLKVYTKTGSYIAKFGTSSFNGTPNDRLTIASDGSIMTKGSVQINDSLNVNDNITATGETSTIKGTIGNFNIININTNGTSALFSTYCGPNSNGNNIYIGGGGQNSYGEQSIPSRGSYNTSLGLLAFQSNELGWRNTSIGYKSLSNNITGSSNTAIGSESLYNNTIGSQNVAIGSSSLESNTIGLLNTAIGYNSLSENTTGDYNCAIGAYSLFKNVNGKWNVALGYSSSFNNISGVHNVSIGNDSLVSNIGGHVNISIGNSSLYSLTGGSNNIAIGSYAGANIGYDDQYSNTYSSDSIFLGSQSAPLNTGETNQIVIGINSVGNGSNSVTIGNDSITKTILKGVVSLTTLNVIGETTTNNLTVTGIANLGTLVFTGGTLGGMIVTGNTITNSLTVNDVSTLKTLNVTGSTTINTMTATTANLGTTKISGNLTATGLTVTTDNLIGKFANFNSSYDDTDAALRLNSDLGMALISNTTGPVGNYLTSTTGTTLLTRAISGNAIYAYSSSGDPLKVYTNTGSYIAKFGTSLYNGTPNDRLTIASDGSIMTKGSVQINDSLNVNDDITATRIVVSGVTIDNVSGGTVNVTRLKFNSEKQITSSNSPGQDGEFYVDRYYIYVYFGNAWRRAALSEWT